LRGFWFIRREPGARILVSDSGNSGDSGIWFLVSGIWCSQNHPPKIRLKKLEKRPQKFAIKISNPATIHAPKMNLSDTPKKEKSKWA